MGEVIQIGKGKFEQIRREHCSHKYLLYDVGNETVHCRDCKAIVSPFQAFLKLICQWKAAQSDLRRRLEELKELETRSEKGLLKAVRRVDHAWRSKKMVPTCPHCDEAIFPEDGFGSSMVNKQMALESQKFRKDIKDTP